MNRNGRWWGRGKRNGVGERERETEGELGGREREKERNNDGGRERETEGWQKDISVYRTRQPRNNLKY